MTSEPGASPLHRAGEIGDHRNLPGVGGGVRRIPVGKQREDVVFGGDCGVDFRRRRVERDAAEQQRLQRLQLHLDPRSAELYRDSRRRSRTGSRRAHSCRRAPGQRRGSSHYSAMSAMSQPSTSPTLRSRKKIGEPSEIEPSRLAFSTKGVARAHWLQDRRILAARRIRAAPCPRPGTGSMPI